MRRKPQMMRALVHLPGVKAGEVVEMTPSREGYVAAGLAELLPPPSPVRKRTAEKAPAKKAPARKRTTKKAATKKAPAKRTRRAKPAETPEGS